MSLPGMRKPPVSELVDQNSLTSTTRGSRAFLPCRAAVVPQDPELRGRDYPPAPEGDRFAVAEAEPRQEALLVLAYLRKGETFAQLAAGFGIGRTTAWRYVNETVELLAARAPKLRAAVRDAKKAGHAYVILDGTLIPIDRVAADRPFYSGKHKKHGMNLQVIASPDGGILWVSGALPGSVHDKKAEWVWGVLGELEKPPGHPGRQGLSGQHLGEDPVPGRNKPGPLKEANRAHAKLRAPGERANAQLKSWKILSKLRCCPWRAGKLAKAIHALQLREA